MNIAMQCCSLMVLIVIMYLYLSCKKVFLNSEFAFFNLLCSTVLCVFMDIISIVMMSKYDYFGRGIVNGVAKFYLITVVYVAVCCLMYIISNVYDKGDKLKISRLAVYGCFAIVCIGICVAPIEFVSDGKVVYSKGLSLYVSYVFLCIFTLHSAALLAKYSRVLNKDRVKVMSLWIILWIAVCVVQAFYKKQLIVSFAITLGMLVVYIRLENPESALDRETGLFNQNTFGPYVSQRFRNGERFSLIMVTFDDFNKAPVSGTIRCKKEIINLFKDIPNTFAFKTNENDIYILYKHSEEAEKMFEILRRRFILYGDKEFRPYISYMPYSAITDNIDDMLHMFRQANRSNEMLEHHYIIIDKAFRDRMMEVQRIEKMVNDAIENNRIEVYYQPIYSTEKHIFTSAEALVRIRDDKGKIIPPATFIEIAELNGTILKLGEIIFDNVCTFIETSDVLQYGLEYIEVNLSVVQCEHEDLAKEFIEIMRKHNISGETINLEITETATLASKKKLIANMIALRNYGVGFSLDDFGTGQSNLNYIVDMPVDIVKFDKEMTTAYFESTKAKYVMDAAMHMIHGMKLDIVSEGVETAEQLDTMEELGIQYIQGYYFSKPLSQNEYLEFIHKNNKDYYEQHNKQ